mmetsp:Transcript_29380/g.42901  ORF Transcript_29380/g.42901 Transcript_29380/m.42901 type:complete len:90 (+) Transcript_29380:1118-1387(+)
MNGLSSSVSAFFDKSSTVASESMSDHTRNADTRIAPEEKTSNSPKHRKQTANNNILFCGYHQLLQTINCASVYSNCLMLRISAVRMDDG